MEEECDVDVESAEDVPDIGGEATTSTYDEGFHDSEDGGGAVKNDKREHHNLLERRRRDHIKESFYGLRDCIPQLHGEKVSRAHILNKATEYIRSMQKCGSTRKGEIEDLRLHNEILEQQIKALDKHKAAGSDVGSDKILEAIKDEVIAKHKDEQQRQNKKINNLVSEKTDSGVHGLVATKSPAPTAAKKPVPQKATTPPSSSDPPVPPSSQAFTLLASNLKSTQSLLTALQKSLPPNSSIPANIKSLAQKVLASPQARQQLQATATSALRGIVTATTVNSNTPPTPVSKQDQTSKDTKTPARQEDTLESPADKTTPAETPGVLVSALTSSPNTGTMSPQQILNTAHLLLQQQGSGLESSDKAAISPEVLSQVSSYLNIPAALTQDEDVGSDEIPNSFLTAALSALPVHTIESAPGNTDLPDVDEEVIEHLAKKPRLETL